MTSPTSPAPTVQGIEILGAISVQNGLPVAHSDGVTYDQASGVVTFKNTKNLRCVPVVTDTFPPGSPAYNTETCFIRDFAADGRTDHFRVWQTPMDRSSDNRAPGSFTAIVVGF